MKTLANIRRRRAALTLHFDPDRNFTALEESCVPSYCHRNVLAAAVAWWRLAEVASLCRKHATDGPLLDFGAGTGEILALLDGRSSYHFVEADDRLAEALLLWHPHARRERLDRLPRRHFATILALDSLEHNEDLRDIVTRLAESLRDDGAFIVSGPTETWLYRFGRRIAGFGGHYHKHTVYDVERTLALGFHMLRVGHVPPLAALFRVSVWQRRRRIGSLD